MVKRSNLPLILAFFILFSTPNLFGKSKKEYLKDFYQSCFKISQERNALGKSQEICQCITRNFKYLVTTKESMKHLIHLYETNHEHGIPQPLITMDQEVAIECNKDGNYLAEKAKKKIEALEKKKKKKTKSKNTAKDKNKDE